MAYKAEIKTTFEPHKVIQPIYTGGSVAIDQQGTLLVSCQGEDALITSLASGDLLARIESDGDTITTLALTPNASHLAVCSRTTTLRIFALSRNEDHTIETTLLRSLKPHAAPVVVSAVDSTGSLLATGGADGVVKVWDIRGGFTTHTFHGHSGVISALHFFKSVHAADAKSSKSRKRKNGQDGMHIDLDASNPTAGFHLASGGEDGKIRIWDLNKRKAVATLDSHVSVVRSLDFSDEYALLLSASRDKTVIAWDAATWQVRSTSPILEGIESAGFVDHGRHFYTGGEQGRLRIWNLKGQEVTQEQEAGVETDAIVNVLHSADLPYLISIHADQIIVFHSLEPLTTASSSIIPPLPISRRIYGTHDEVIDLAYVGRDSSLMALATNSEDVRLVSVQDHATSSVENGNLPSFGTDVGLLKGHQDIIITIDVDWSGHWLATGAKDNAVKLWRLDPDKRDFACFATLTGHAESISAVSLPHDRPPADSKAFLHPLDHPPTFMITGSQDKTIKKWDIVSAARGKPGASSRAAYTRKAHDKDINAIDISPLSAGTMFASASQDRTVKIWDYETGESIGVLRGHKRGVWSVAFAPASTPIISGQDGQSSGSRGMAVTGSGDKTVRIWSLNDYSCLRTFEGHTNSVLKVVWLPVPRGQERKRHARGVQVASAAGDGLVKIWDAQEDECAATLDNHTDRVWALVVKPVDADTNDQRNDEMQVDGENSGDEETTAQSGPPLELVSGSADSTITFWQDTTLLTSQASASRAVARVEQDQQLQNHMRASNYREAIVLALQLNHPKRLLDLFTRVVDENKDRDSLTGNLQVDQVLRAALTDSQLHKLLLRTRDWNANARSCRVAQRILYALFRLHPKEKFLRLDRARLDEKRKMIQSTSEEVGDENKQNTIGGQSVRDIIDGLGAYTEKHYARMEKMAEQRHVLAWTLQMMDETAVVVS